MNKEINLGGKSLTPQSPSPRAELSVWSDEVLRGEGEENRSFSCPKVEQAAGPHEPDPVGTRCPASGLGFRLWTRGSASLPFNFFPAPGYTQGEDAMVRTSRLSANVDNHLPLTSMATMFPQIDALPGTKRQASIQYGN